MPRKKGTSRSSSRRYASKYDDDRSYRESRRDRESSRDRYSSDDDVAAVSSKGSRSKRRSYYRQSSSQRYSSDDDVAAVSSKGSRSKRRSYYRQSSSHHYSSDDDVAVVSSKGSRSKRRSYYRQSSSSGGDEDRSRSYRRSQSGGDEDRSRSSRRSHKSSRKRSRTRKKLGPSRGGSEIAPSETRRQAHRRRNNNHTTSKNASAIDNVKLIATLEGDGLTIVTMASDGNCLFRAVSDQLYADYGDRHEEVRSKICDFMEDKEDEYSMFLVIEEDDDDHDATDFESYIRDTRRDGVWGGHLELQAAARLYRRNITVYSATLDAFTIDCHPWEASGADLLLSFHSGDHYNSVHRNAGTINSRSASGSSRSRKLTKRFSSRRLLKATVDESSSSPLSTSAAVTTAVNMSSSSPLSSTSAASPVTVPQLWSQTVDPAAPQEYAPENMNSSGQQNVVDATVTSVHDLPVSKYDPCPCGSGKRYKRCCLPKFKEEQKEARKRDRRERYDSRPNQDKEDIVGEFKVLQI